MHRRGRVLSPRNSAKPLSITKLCQKDTHICLKFGVSNVIDTSQRLSRKLVKLSPRSSRPLNGKKRMSESIQKSNTKNVGARDRRWFWRPRNEYILAGALRWKWRFGTQHLHGVEIGCILRIYPNSSKWIRTTNWKLVHILELFLYGLAAYQQ